MWLSRRVDESSRNSASTAGSISWASSTISTGRDSEASICVCQRSRSTLAPAHRLCGGQLDAEQVAHLAIEVGEAGLGPADDTILTSRCPPRPRVTVSVSPGTCRVLDVLGKE
jgi:hypothetical protein